MSEVDWPTTVPPGELTVTEDGLRQRERDIHNQKITCGITKYSSRFASIMPIQLENSIFTFIMSLIPQSYSHNVQSYYVRVCCTIAQLLRFAIALCGIVLGS